MVLLKRAPRHLRALKPAPSSREHLQAPLRRYVLKARASPDFPLWRYYQKMMGLHRRLASLCVVGVIRPVATPASTADPDNEQPCTCVAGLHNKILKKKDC